MIGLKMIVFGTSICNYYSKDRKSVATTEKKIKK